MTRKQLIIALLIAAVGVVVFSATYGLEQRYLFRKYAHVAMTRPPTPTELREMFLLGAVEALPYGALVALIIVLATSSLARRLRISSTFFRPLVGGGLGSVAGCLLAGAYLLLWRGPGFSFVLPPIVAGAPIGFGIFALLRPPPLLPGHCACGYNLTGNESGVCPECGTPI